MTPMPPEIARTLAAHRMIIGKVQVLLGHRQIAIGPVEAISLAMLPPESITVVAARRKKLIVGSNVYQTVEKLHRRGLITCSNGEGRKNLAMTLTPKGVELAEAVRKALGGQEMKLEAAE